MCQKLSLPLLALIGGLVLLPPATLAQAVAPDATSVGQSLTTRERTVTPDTALGALAAVGCGLFVRVTIATAGTQVGTIAGAVACCGYMLFDAFVLEPR
jgi:hypothetical protein